MKRFGRQCVINSYSGLKTAQLVENKIPVIRCSRQVLVKVHCSSLNPLDARMSEGYGANVINSIRRVEQGLPCTPVPEFPLVLGRDLSGVVVDAGSSVRKEFPPGTEVFGATFPSQPGAHQEYVTVDASSIISKPAAIPHSSAASVAYAGLTAWAALVTTGGLDLSNCSNRRVLVLGGGGGVGSVAVQLAVGAGAEVVAVAGPESEASITEMGAIYLNYRGLNYTADLISLSGFDLVLDCAGMGSKAKNLAPLLRTGGCVVTLDSPLLKNTDRQGLLVGGAQSLAELLSANLKTVEAGNTVRWAYFSPSLKALGVLRDMLADKKLKPIIDRNFTFSDILNAYQFFTTEKTKGKVLITM